MAVANGVNQDAPVLKNCRYSISLSFGLWPLNLRQRKNAGDVLVWPTARATAFVRSLRDGLLGFALSHRYVPSLVSALRVYIPNACVFQTL